MALDPVALKNAYVATPSPAGSAPFGPTGIGIRVTGFNATTFVKFVAQASLTYTVGTNVLPGDIFLDGPNGNPINPGVAIKTFSFTPLSTGLYVLGFVANPRFVVSGQTIFVNINAQPLHVPISIKAALDPSSLLGTVRQIVNGGGTVPGFTQYFLHLPDGNGNGLATSDPTMTDPTTVNVAADASDPTLPNVPPDGVPVGQADQTNTFLTPLETNPSNGLPLTWVGATDAPGMPGDPTHISVALAGSNFPEDASVQAPFSGAFPQGFVPLVVAAEDIWELVANVKFDNKTDTPTDTNPPDIRVGVAGLIKALGAHTIGFTHYSFDANNKFLPDNLVKVDAPAETPVTALPDGDFLYNGTKTTVFQALLHEFGHAIGLDHNPTDPNSIMNPVLSSTHPFPDAEDIASAQALYGKPTVQFSAPVIDALTSLITGSHMV